MKELHEVKVDSDQIEAAFKAHQEYLEQCHRLYEQISAVNSRLDGMVAAPVTSHNCPGLLLAATVKYEHAKNIYGSTSSEMAFIITATGIYVNHNADALTHSRILRTKDDVDAKVYLDQFFGQLTIQADRLQMAIDESISMALPHTPAGNLSQVNA